jgi:myo-inositol 2-dehydrogenase/D-chiro-inositol 1-dehydrogenase
MAAESKTVRFGLVGYGAWGACHARAIQEEATLVAVCAATPESRARAAEALGPGVAICASDEELVRREEVDVVDVVVPNHLHRQVAVAALAAGKHVLLEKPMAPTVEDAEAIAAAARQSGRLLAIGHEARLSPQWGKIKELIAAGAIGEPRMAAIHLWRFPYRLGASGWRYDRARVGSWTLEEPIHYFDLIRWYLDGAGAPQRVFACANSVRPDERPELYDNLAALVTFPGGVYGTVTQTLAAYEYHLRGEVVGTRGAIRTWWLGEIDRTDRPTFAFEYFDGSKKHDLQLESTPGELFELHTEIAAMARAVAAGERQVPGLADAEDGLWAVRLCLAAEESARTGAPIAVAGTISPHQAAAPEPC